MAEIYAGLRVIELASLVSGPYCGRIFAGLGADVIKIERPGDGDPARHRPPFMAGGAGLDQSALFFSLNPGKRSITLDPSQPQGRKLLHQLLAKADVLIEDIHPTQKAALGVDYESLKRVNPRLVVASITPFGLTGPYRNYHAYELQVFHAGGEGNLLPNGLTYEMFPSRPPLKVGGMVAQYQAGMAAASAIAAALMLRLDDDLGQEADISQHDVQLTLSCMALQRYVAGFLEHRSTRSFRYGGVLPCADGFVEVLVIEQRQWVALMAMIGDPEWSQAANLQDAVQRAQFGTEINVHLREWSIQHKALDVVDLGMKHGVPIGLFSSPAEVCGSEHEQERGFFESLPRAGADPVAVPTFPFHFSATPHRLGSAAPGLGQDNEKVLSGELGLSPQQLEELQAAGVV